MAPPEGAPPAGSHRARPHASLGDARLDEAIRGLDAGIARLGDPVALELYAIDLELRRGRTDAALARLDRIARRSPRKEAWLAQRGGILERAGRMEEAREAYKGARGAIGVLPPSRRSTRATARLEMEIAAALARLGAAGPGREARAP
jgi:predicted Zn-dependent protease